VELVDEFEVDTDLGYDFEVRYVVDLAAEFDARRVVSGWE
jgi:hypothetical protein